MLPGSHQIVYVFQAAAKGRLAEFEKLYFEDTKRISLVDGKGRTALHHAAKHGHNTIMEFIFQHGGSKVTSLFILYYCKPGLVTGNRPITFYHCQI